MNIYDINFVVKITIYYKTCLIFEYKRDHQPQTDLKIKQKPLQNRTTTETERRQPKKILCKEWKTILHITKNINTVCL